MELEPVIGLEIHVHLNTASKLFCTCQNVSEAEEPNRFMCPVCMGYPGTLPVLNTAAVESAIRIGLALHCTIAGHTFFARKSYFYPDLPKGYQISQYEEPICGPGHVTFSVGDEQKTVRITRAHLEEDAAKNVHETADHTFVDYTRAGTPLVEIVTEPDLQSSRDAKIFLENLQRTMRYLGVSNADMEHGDLRVDVNISLRPRGGALSPKTEIKNVNSFRAVERAIEYEIRRQTELWEGSGTPMMQSTRGWDDGKQVTVEQRVKEAEADYRYFPEPDIPPLRIDPALVERLTRELPELPIDKEKRFLGEYFLAPDKAHLLVDDRTLAEYAEAVFSECANWNKERVDVHARDTQTLWTLATNYLLGDFRNLLAAKNMTAATSRISAENFAELIVMLHRSEVNRNAIPLALEEMEKTGGDASTVVEALGLSQVSDDESLRRLVQNVILANPAEVDKVRSGKTQVLQFLMGRVMAETKGRAHPEKVMELLQKELGLSL